MHVQGDSMKTSELTGAALDWAVAIAIGEYRPVAVPSYSTDWSQGGPIIDKEDIDTVKVGVKQWRGRIEGGNPVSGYGPTPLIAAMRCYVASKLGDDINIPEELL
jgi:hypothetical protein